MSILIKGMEMPKHCIVCVLKNAEDDCMAQKWQEWETWEEMRKGCPLVEVPEKHGRLIDADALVPDVCHDWEDSGYLRSDDYSEKCIRNAPTVIEAEWEG